LSIIEIKHFLVARVARAAIMHPMRMKVAPSKKHKARGVSLPPDMSQAVSKKLFRMPHLSFSSYVQRLIQNDMKNNVIGQILADDAERAA